MLLFVSGRHYRVTLDLARPSKAEAWVQGFMRVSLYSDDGIIRNLDLTPKSVEKIYYIIFFIQSFFYLISTYILIFVNSCQFYLIY